MNEEQIVDALRGYSEALSAWDSHRKSCPDSLVVPEPSQVPRSLQDTNVANDGAGSRQPGSASDL